jgi:cathepsin B
VHGIRDQGACGACWAFGAAEVLSDRFCIASNGSINVTLSPQDLISCDIGKYNMGCAGGVPEYAWRYLETTGISTDDCIPYIENAADTCPLHCKKASHAPYKKYKVLPGSTILINGAASAAQQYIAEAGPVQAVFEVFQDFFAYESGIYRHVNGSLLGKHSVKIVGFGVENGTAYWTAANSWGDEWGMEGYFRIARGSSGCGIESEIVLGKPLLL